VKVLPLESKSSAAWDAYVHEHPQGSPFHLLAWKRSVESVFGFEPRYLTAVAEDGSITGVLPLFLIRNPLMGRVLMSTPFAVYGGALTSSDAAREAFAAELRRLGDQLGVQYVELRNAYPEQCLGFSPVDRYVTFTQTITPDEEEVLNAIPRKTRAAVRKSLKFDLAGRQTREWGRFEDLYARNLRKLGTPCFPRKWFGTLLENFGDAANVHEVVDATGKQVAAAVLTFYFGDQVLPYYGASDPAFNPQQPNNFMYYDLMRFGGNNGYKVFDFGRSKREGSGSFDFKAHWGMTERPLPYEILLVRRKELPHFSPNNPKFQFAIKAWRNVPMPIARAIGPMIVRMVP
jgi:FemAB-related protein (PEP-CTERM system-associated)